MLANGLKINECDKCVYVKTTQRGYVITCLYVDDMLIIGSNTEVISSTFDMKDMGVTDVILGIKISKTSEGLVLSLSRPKTQMVDLRHMTGHRGLIACTETSGSNINFITN